MTSHVKKPTTRKKSYTLYQSPKECADEAIRIEGSPDARLMKSWDKLEATKVENVPIGIW